VQKATKKIEMSGTDIEEANKLSQVGSEVTNTGEAQGDVRLRIHKEDADLSSIEAWGDIYCNKMENF
jgi:hypothetical protein